MGIDEPIARLTVPFDVGRLTPNRTRRMHWGEISRLTAAAHLAARAAYLQAGSPVAAGPVTVALTVRRARRIDPDAVLGGSKALLDQLFCRERWGYGLTPDDSARYVAYAPVAQETGARWKGREEVEVLVMPRGETP